MGKYLVMTLVVVVVGGLLGILVWGLVLSGGRPGGLVVNTIGGEVPVPERPARPLELELFDGDTIGLEDLRGKVVMVDFWASRCPPCRQEAPILARIYQEYEGQGVEFVGVSIWDTERDARAYIERYGITFPTGIDEQGRIAIDYGVTGIPEKYFISPDGDVLKKFVGPTEEDRLRQLLDEMLAESQ